MDNLTKTGEVLDRDEDGQLWLCESWLNEETGVTHTTRTFYQENVVAEPEENWQNTPNESRTGLSV
jgi:hypothetical protein